MKSNQKYRIFPFLPVLLLAVILNTGCGSAQDEGNAESSVRIVTAGMNAWIDYMPGGPETFHCSGTVTLLQDSTLKPVTISLKNIDVYQANELVFSFKPEFESRGEVSGKLEPGEMKVFRFISPQGIKAESLDPERDILLELDFFDGTVPFTFLMNNIKIKKVY